MCNYYTCILLDHPAKTDRQTNRQIARQTDRHLYRALKYHGRRTRFREIWTSLVPRNYRSPLFTCERLSRTLKELWSMAFFVQYRVLYTHYWCIQQWIHDQVVTGDRISSFYHDLEGRLALATLHHCSISMTKLVNTDNSLQLGLQSTLFK